MTKRRQAGVGLNASARQGRAARLEAVLEYIDAHPGASGDVEFLSRLASISPFHFHRVMSSYLGESVSAYARRRTLERAALRLLLDGSSVTTCSALAGYASCSAFARAFRRQFGSSPRKLAQDLVARGASNAACLPGGVEFRSLPEQRLHAVRRYGPQPQAAAAAWATLETLLAGHVGARSPGLIGIPCTSPELTPTQQRRYDACVDIALPADGELVRKRIVAGDYAVFQFRGTLAALEDAHMAVRWHWYPQAAVRMRDAPSFHRLYKAADDGELQAEIFFPIERLPSAWRGSVAHSAARSTAAAAR